jgi:hypothetical protein
LGEDLANLIGRAVNGDLAAIEVQALLAEGRVGQVLADAVGSPAEWLRHNLIAQASEENLLVQEALRRKLDAVRAELEGPDPTPIERLLAERASLCWLMVYWYESLFQSTEGMSMRDDGFHQQRIDRAHARFLSAVRTLAVVRKLAVPALLMSIAKNQVNVAVAGS